ncbi:hypothetical protein PINS_up008230 [Pythium insidiosum]|nr:hypothetical protein PINS_up008230 [Pythium insidiosum]
MRGHVFDIGGIAVVRGAFGLVAHDNEEIDLADRCMMSDAPKNPLAPRFPVIVENPTYADIRGNFNGQDYLRWGGITALSFPLGYVFGVKVHPRVARPSMWVTGVLGSLGGFLLAYQSSSFRLQGRKANDGEVKKYISSQQN